MLAVLTVSSVLYSFSDGALNIDRFAAFSHSSSTSSFSPVPDRSEPGWKQARSPKFNFDMAGLFQLPGNFLLAGLATSGASRWQPAGWCGFHLPRQWRRIAGAATTHCFCASIRGRAWRRGAYSTSSSIAIGRSAVPPAAGKKSFPDWQIIGYRANTPDKCGVFQLQRF